MQDGSAPNFGIGRGENGFGEAKPAGLAFGDCNGRPDWPGDIGVCASNTARFDVTHTARNRHTHQVGHLEQADLLAQLALLDADRVVRCLRMANNRHGPIELQDPAGATQLTLSESTGRGPS